MTQAFNLSQFANKLNSSGQTDNTGLQNSAVTVTAGTGMSGGGSVALGSSVTLTNAGVTSVAAGTGISVSASTGGITITNTAPASGGVTSVTGGNGITSSGGTTPSISLGIPTNGSVGTYVLGGNIYASAGSVNYGSSYTFGDQSQYNRFGYTDFTGVSNGGSMGTFYSPALSGTWRWLGNSGYQGTNNFALLIRIA
jgi:hypothetical protein